MRLVRVAVLAALAAAPFVAGHAFAEDAAPPVIGQGSYGQELVTRLMAAHPDVSAMTLYITVKGGSGPESIAASDGKTGTAPPAAAAQALAAWRAHFAYDKASKQLDADLPMLDMSHKKAGVMTLTLRGKSGAALA